MANLKKNATADVCLILEGTYPYVSGGVSTWVHQIISALPHLSFSIFFLGANKKTTGEKKYDVPKNVLRIEEVYLFDPLPRSESTPGNTPEPVSQELYRQMANFLRAPSLIDGPENFLNLAKSISSSAGSFPCANLWRDRAARDIMEGAYRDFMPDESFLNFFWSSRFLVEPAWKLIRAVDRIPKAKVYHSLCTGYAGMAASMAARHHKAFFLLSEHGIYLKERIAEIQNASWMNEIPPRWSGLFQELSAFKRLWVEFFRLLGQVSYDAADQITSLFGYNRDLQIEYGALNEKIEIIPNGIRPTDFTEMVAAREKALERHTDRQNVGFLGRIVRIKDVKTLIRAARIVCDACPKAYFMLAGPTDEDPEYFKACQELRGQLGLEENLEFVGLKKREEFLVDIDLMVLTSVSEGLPFVILESFAAGIPVVSSDVGACRELIAGKPGESPSLGHAGLITSIAQPEETARALIKLLQNPGHRKEMGDAGFKRAEIHYDQDSVVRRYEELYTLKSVKAD
jgi:glycosyltransferase involved in cell wall biosynthesis